MLSLRHGDQFYWLDRLGVGATRVRKVRHKYNSQVCFATWQLFADEKESACKEIIPDPTTTFDVRCIDAVARSNHPNIVQVLDRWVDQWPMPKVFIQAELCTGDLNQYIELHRSTGRQIPWQNVWSITLEIVEGLTYAHELGWSHRNLKPRNGILLLIGQRLQ